MEFYYGVVENRDDPLKLGRCQVRIVGLHTHDKSILPTVDLPWSYPVQPVTSAAMNGIGWSPTGPVPGTSVIIIFADKDKQQPLMFGTVGGIPQSKAAAVAAEDGGNIVTDGGAIRTSDGQPVKNKDGSDLTISNQAGAATKQLEQQVTNVRNKALAVAKSILGVDLSKLFGGGSANADTAEMLPLPVEGADQETKPTIIPKVVATEESKIDSQPTPGKADAKVLNTPVTVKPMPKYVRKGEEGKAQAGCQAIISACDRLGLTSKYAKASILAIVGGESAWVPRDEGHVYTNPQSLLSIFPSVFKGDVSLATAYSAGKKTKEEFFEFIYGNKFPKGQGLGNKLAGDGGKYFGRGFNQLTGKAGYKQAQDKLKAYGKNVDLLANPSLLNEDLEVAALACVIFYKENVKHDINDPGYFKAARDRTGADAGGGYAKKETMYQYFLGEGVMGDSTIRPSAEDGTGKKYSQQEVSHLPPEQQAALLEDRAENSTIGFKDPGGKYPLRELLNEPDTNRLARGVIKDTSIAYKDQTRTTGIPGPFKSSWEQPIAPFGGRYPYNKVMETESGHVMMFDDTTGHETVSIYHRKGSFLDIDSNGTQVNKIVGDGYTIYDRNGMIYIAGKCNLTVGNSVNIMVLGDANIEVNGATNAILHGQTDIGVGDDLNLAVAGDFTLQVGGNFNTIVGGDFEVNAKGTPNANADNTDENAGDGTDTSGDTANANLLGGNIYLNSGASTKIQATKNITALAEGYIAMEATGEFSALAGENMLLTATAEMNIAAGDNVNVDGSEFHGQEGSATEADVVSTFVAIASAIEYPAKVTAKQDAYELFTTPVRPAPSVDAKYDMTAMDDFYANPDKYYDPAAEAGGVNATRPPQPDIGDKGLSLPPTGQAEGDIAGFLTTQLSKAKEGYWAETGMKGGPSNPNIIASWKDIGLGSVGVNDQVPWCMCFVNWTLKQCGYRYVQTARAFDIRDKPQRWGAAQVSEPQPGDVIVWKYSHVSFVWKYEKGKIYPVGGNQGGGKVSDNNPVGGTVSQAYPNGIPPGHKDIVAIYRPSKA